MLRNGAPDTIAGWKALVDGPLTDQACVRGRMWPRITRFDDRWRWIETSIVPRFRRFNYAGNPCVLPQA
ncbi:MAG TPA: hypothetical protein VFN44_24565 [Solirubrobacteraceae bacterium]|nr:hypothetical protein [Solirubrobacteraceae bacterium]